MSTCPRVNESTGVLLIFLFVGTFALCVFFLRKAFQPVRFRPLETTALSFFSVAFFGMPQIQQIVGAGSASCFVTVSSYYLAAAGFIGVIAWRAVRVAALYTIQRLLLSDAESKKVADQEESGDSDDASDLDIETNMQITSTDVSHRRSHGLAARQSTLSANLTDGSNEAWQSLVKVLTRAIWAASMISCSRKNVVAPTTKLGMIRKLRSFASRRTGRVIAAALAVPVLLAGTIHASVLNGPETNCTECTTGGIQHLVVLLLSAVLAGPLLATCRKLVNGVSDAFTVVVELKSLTVAFLSVTIARFIAETASGGEPAQFASDTLGVAFGLFCISFSLLFPSRESFRDKFAAANAQAAAGALISSKSLSAFEEAALVQEGSSESGLSAHDLAAWKLGWAAPPNAEQLVSYFLLLCKTQGPATSAQVMDKIYASLELGTQLQILPSGALVLESAVSVESVLHSSALANMENGRVLTSPQSTASLSRASAAGSSKDSGSSAAFGSQMGSFIVDKANFSAPTLSLVLHIPKLRKLFKAYLRNEFSAENLLFWEKVETLNRIHRRLAASAQANRDLEDQSEVLFSQEKETCKRIIENFIEVNSPLQVNISASQRRAILKAAAEGNLSVQMFDRAHEEIFNLMQRDGYSRFKGTSEFALGLKRAELQMMKRSRRNKSKPQQARLQTQDDNSADGSSVYGGDESDAPDEHGDPFSKPGGAGAFSSRRIRPAGPADSLDEAANPFASPKSTRKFSSPKAAQAAGDEADAFSKPGGSKRFSSPKAAQAAGDEADAFSKPGGSKRFSSCKGTDGTAKASSGATAKVAPAP